MRLFSLFVLFFATLTFSLKAEEEHKVFQCRHSLETLSWIEELLGHAEEVVEFAVPFLGGEVGLTLLEAMEKRLAENKKLQIYLLMHPLFMEKSEETLLTHLVKSYPERFHLTQTAEVAVALPEATSINIHLKLLVVDEKYFVVGGTNLDDYMCAEGTYKPEHKRPRDMSDPKQKFLPSGARDSDVVCKGPCAKELRICFHKLFALWENYAKTKLFDSNPEHFVDKSHYFPLLGEAAYISRFEESDKLIVPNNLRMVFSGAMDQPNKISLTYQKLIRSSTKSILIGNLYFNPLEEIYNPLLEAINRAVAFTYVGNGMYEGVTPKFNNLYCWGNRVNYLPLYFGRTFYFWESYKSEELTPKETHIYEYCVEDILYHKKVMVVDEKYTVIGSFNLGLRSTMGDYELVLVIDSEELAQKQIEIFNEDISHSKEITLEEAHKWYFDLWTQYVGGLQKHFHGFI